MNKLATGSIASWAGSDHDDGLATLLQTESILPTQYWGAAPADERSAPERRLLLAILEDALITLLQHRHRDDLASRRLVVETQKWIASDRHTSAFDFAGLCDILGIEPSYIRALLRRLPHLLGIPQRRRRHSGRGHHKVRTPSRRRRR